MEVLSIIQVNESSLPSNLSLKTREEWQAFEASLLTVGLFERLPVSSGNNASTRDDDAIRTLWRSVITRALFDILRGPTVNATSPPRKNPGSPSKEYLKKLKHHTEVVLRRSNAIYRDAVHWLHSGKTVTDWLDYEEEGTQGVLRERDSDFVVTCELAELDPGLVKSIFIKLIKQKEQALDVQAN